MVYSACFDGDKIKLLLSKMWENKHEVAIWFENSLWKIMCCNRDVRKYKICKKENQFMD